MMIYGELAYHYRPSALNETQWKSIGLLGKMLMVIRSEKIAIISGNRDVETEENMSSTSN